MKTISLIRRVYVEGCVSPEPLAARQAERLCKGRIKFVKTNSKLRYLILCGLFHTAQINGRGFEKEGVQIRQKCMEAKL